MQRDPLAFLTSVAREYGDASSFKFGPQAVYFFNHPELIRDVLVTKDRSFMKGRALQRTKILLGEGLLTSEGDLHRRQRRLMAPAFHRDRVTRYAEVMIANAVRTADAWRDGETIDVAHEMMRLTLSVVAQALFGADVSGEADEIGTALTQLLENFNLTLSPLSAWLERLPLPRVRAMKSAIARLDRTIYSMIHERRRSGADRGDLLSMLLLAQDEEGGGGMSDQQVRDEAMTLFLAGHETTANALSWTWYLLAQDPEVERRLHEEVDRMSRPPAVDARLPFTQAVLSESMRLYPPAWLIGRLALEDVAIGSVTVPRGAVVIVSQYVMHRDARFWPDPHRFDPSRFLNGAERPKFAYFPFGGGSRTCIGEGFAWTEGVLVLATIAQRWRLTLAQKEAVRPQPMITLRPRGGVRMHLEARAALTS
jgi:cytochrome P450